MSNINFSSLQFFKIILFLSAIKSVIGYQELFDSQIPVKLGNDCDLRVNNDHEFQSCRSRTFEDWSTYDRTQRIKYGCCFNWDIIDCQEKSVKNLCDRTQYEDEYKSFMAKKWEWVYQYEKHQCIDYPYGSASCRFPIWAIILIVFGCLVVIALLTSICIYVRKRSNALPQKRYNTYR